VNLRWKKALISSAVAFTGFMAFGGFLHTSAGRPLLRRIGGCPVGKVSPTVVQAERDRVVASQRGTASAPEGVLPLALRRDDLSTVKAWTKAKKLECEEKREGTVYACTNVPAQVFDDSAPAGDVLPELVFGFRVETKKLESIQAFRTGLTAAQAAAHTNRVRDRLRSKLGAPTVDKGPGDSTGPYDAATLGKPFATVSVQYRFSDLVIDVTTTSIPGSGVAFRENYLSGLAGS
jgi:hypothetical protein